MTPFYRALDHTLDIEGDWSNHRLDPGGRTKFGITEALAERYGLDVATLTPPQAQHIYFNHFWEPMALSEVAAIDGGDYVPVAMELFEAGVNGGRALPGRWLQQWLNRLNYQERWEHLVMDGAIGPKTLAALQSYAYHREDLNGDRTLWICLNAEQVCRFGRLVDSRPERFGAFVFGWVRQRGKTIPFSTDS